MRARRAFPAALLLAGLLALVRYKPTGARNRSFGRKGKVVTPFLGKAWQEGTGVVVQPDGKIVAAGSTGAGFALARYNPSGSLDPSFGSGGKVVTPLGSDAGANGVALQDDGKIVLAGRLANEYLGKSDFVLARYKADGSPDPSFGLGGVVTTPIGSGSSSARAVLIQPDGKIVAAGVVVLSTAGADELRFALARYNPNGSLDTSFGAGGEVTTAFFLCECDEAYGVEATAVALQPDGKIVAAGGTLNSFMARDEFALARYNPSGSLDASFGTGGKVTTSFGFPPPEMGSTGDFAEALAMQPDGKIVATGESNFGPHGEQFDDALARYKPDGSLDKSFAKDGTSSPAFKICIVPKLRGTTLPKARRMIRKRRCRAGKVTTAFSGKVKAGRVISQKPRAHSWHRKGTKVSLVVSAGRR